MSRLSLRLRLTVAFALVMAAVLSAVGFFVYSRVGGAMLTSVDQSLRAGASETAAHLARADLSRDFDFSLVDPDNARGETFGQLLDARGRVLRSTPSGLPPLVGHRLVDEARQRGRILTTTGLRGRKSEWRVLALPVIQQGRTLVLVEASSLAAREDTLDRLLFELGVAGPVALLLASLAGYALAAGALRPVESMRRRAEAVSAQKPGLRLPVPPSRDEIARLAETLNAMLSRLEASIEHERRFVADASHELRTPLALLKTELELALRRPRSRAELESALRSAAEETERLTALAEDLLLIAYSDQSGLPVRPRSVDAEQLLQETADRFSARAASAGRKISASADAQLLVLADSVRVEQALGNLVDNALTHGAGAIELFACRRERLVELHVADEGDGFPPGFAERAFDRFSRGDEARGRMGTGLGLAIVDVIARAHGGRAGTTERNGGGADVWIALQPAGSTAEHEPAPDAVPAPS
jgi:two-component system OmpR family sensor kinase